MGQPAGWSPAEPIIELGELGEELPAGGGEGPIRPARGLALALVAVLAATSLIGDAARALLRPVLTTPFVPADFDLTGDVLYAFDSSYAPNSVTAYGLGDAQRLWRLASANATSFETVTRIGGQTLLAPNACVEPEPVRTLAVSTRSGRELWRRRGVPARPIADGRLVLMSRPGPTLGCGTGYTAGDSRPVFWDAVDTATGAVAWTLEIPQSVRISFDSDEEQGARWAVLIARDGTVASRDLLTGAVAGQAMLPELALPALPGADRYGPASAPNLMVAGSQAMVVRRITSRVANLPAVLEVSAYDLATFTRRWTVRADAGRTDLRPGFDYLSLSGCGPVLCLRGSAWTVFLDPRTGAERWRTSLSLLATRGGRALLADPEANNGQGAPGGLTVRDVSTGELRGDLAGWRVLGGDRSRATAPVLGFTAGDRTWFARLDLSRARVVAVGSAPGWYGSCLAAPEYIACRRVDGSVRVWRAPGT